LRGSSALRDGARWVAMLERRPFVEGAPELLDLQVGKSNYTRRTALVLCADPEREGAMRAATEAEIANYDAAKAPARAGRASQRQKRDDQLAGCILEALSERPASTNELVGQLKAGRERVSAATAALAAEGHIGRVGGRNGVWQVVWVGGPDHPSRSGGLWSGGPAPEGGRRPDHQTGPQASVPPTTPHPLGCRCAACSRLAPVPSPPDRGTTP